MPNNPPDWLTGKQQREWWKKPWTVPLSSSQAKDFKRKLWQHGFVTPNFRRLEAGGTKRHPQGCPVPASLRNKCQYHGFALERVRHDLGDKPLSPLSWYRCPPHNSAVGGASSSQHMQAWATDWSDAERAKHGGDRFDNAMHKQFARGGRGVVGGTRRIRHVDNGPARTWSY